MPHKELGGLSAKCLLHKPEDLISIPGTHEKKSVACNSNVGWPGQEGPGGSRRIPGSGYLTSQSRSVKDPVTHTKTRWTVLEE